MQDLGVLPGSSLLGVGFSSGTGINDSDEVVGFCQLILAGIMHGFLFDHGVMYDLNNLVVPPTPWTIQWATGINNAGEISAIGFDSTGERHALLLEPERRRFFPGRPLGN